MSDPLLICGASCRALAQSAARLGLDVTVLDLFADRDTRRVAAATKVHDYPRGFAALAGQMKSSQLIYTGGLENYPALLDQLASDHSLLGNAGNVVAEVRDIPRLMNVLESGAIAFPTTVTDLDLVAGDGWLLKPHRSAGGAAVTPVSGMERVLNSVGYAQRWLAGEHCGATFVANGRSCRLIGVCRQLLGPTMGDWLAPSPDAALEQVSPFRYGGSIGPLHLAPHISAQWQRIGDLLTEVFSLRGIFGVDGVVNGFDVVPVEVNPRPTASLEVLERTLGFNAIEVQQAACLEGELAVPNATGLPQGKLIIFAPNSVQVTEQTLQWVEDVNRDWIADIPAEPQFVSAQHPVCTVFGTGSTQAEVEAELRANRDQVLAQLSVADANS